jgi:hypothetical protein
MEFANSYCGICQIWTLKQIFHCEDCGICKIGTKDTLFHCKTCGICFNKSDSENTSIHQCANQNKLNLERHIRKKTPCIQIHIDTITKNVDSQKLIKAPKSSPLLSENKLIYKQTQIDLEIESDKDEPACRYCLKKFSKNSNLTRHLKDYCRVKKQQDEEKEDIFKRLLLQETLLKEKDAQIYKLIYQNDVLINKISVLEEKVYQISSIWFRM